MPALALIDNGGVYGAVRFLLAARKFGVKPVIGASLEVEGEPLVMLARSLAGYSRLCRLLSLAHRDQPKGEARSNLAAVATHRGDLFYLTTTDAETRLRSLQEALGRENVFVELHRIGLTPQDPSYEEWEGAFYIAMKERRGRYGEMDPRQVTDEFGRIALQTLGKAADESIVLEIARTALKVVRANDLIANTQRLSQIAG